MSNVLVLNSGSSSLKYQLVNPETGEALAVGLVERIGEPMGRIKHEYNGTETVREMAIPDHAAALQKVLDLFNEVGPDLNKVGISAVGHRVVHGGTKYSRPEVITDEVVEGIKEISPLAPLHNPANVTGIEAARKLFDVPQVAIFDTAFFSTLPPEAYTYAINRGLADQYQIRRYGFHGTSHKYVSEKVASLLGRDDLKMVILHLGNGASASAVVNGKAIDTSMGLTPLEGLVMGTRSGDLDPAIIFHLARVAKLDIADLDELLNKFSGMKGLTGVSDMREVHALIAEGDEAAKVGYDVYIHRLVKYVGSYAAEMNGIDVLVFTAGVGENDHIVRRDVVKRLSFLGLDIDEAKNEVRSREPRIISPEGHHPLVMVVPTNEEFEIAQESIEALDHQESLICG